MDIELEKGTTLILACFLTLLQVKHAYYKAVKEAEAAKSSYDESMEQSKTYSSKVTPSLRPPTNIFTVGKKSAKNKPRSPSSGASLSRAN